MSHRLKKHSRTLSQNDDKDETSVVEEFFDNDYIDSSPIEELLQN